MNSDVSQLFSGLARALEGELSRDRETLVPPAYQVLWEVVRFLVLYGGRSAAKSWSIARVLLILAHEQPIRVLCCREIQGSLRESAFRLLADTIQALQLDDHFDVQVDSIIGRNGSKFFFEGLRYNASKIRSYEGVDLVWVEEAQAVSELSWETLLPTIRKPGSRFFISFNPVTHEDPVFKRFVATPPPGCIARKVSYRDNPFLSPEADAERAWLERTDPDAYRHVWEGEFRTISDAQILRGKFVAEEFAVMPGWAGPYHGLDYGFSRDPSAAVRCFIDDDTRTLYITHEFWQLGADIDALPGMLESAIPGISSTTVYADSARPETTSYISRNGIPGIRSAEKWPGSVDDGIAYLRTFDRIVINPACKHLLDECRSYSFKQDRLTGVPLPEPEDKNNHLIDALRYALSPLVRNKPSGGYFSRAALLVHGEPAEPMRVGMPECVFMTAATCEQPGTAIGVIYWSVSSQLGWPLVVLDYDVVEVEDANEAWLAGVFKRAQELRVEWNAQAKWSALWAEEPLFATLGEVFKRYLQREWAHLIQQGTYPPVDVRLAEDAMVSCSSGIRIPEIVKYEPRLDDRAERIRGEVNGGRHVKVARSAYARQVTFRSVTSNTLLAQLLSYRPGQRDAALELVSAFIEGLRLTQIRVAPGNVTTEAYTTEQRNNTGTSTATTELAVQSGVPSVARPKPKRIPGVFLSTGSHEVDGQIVVAGNDAANPHWNGVHHPLPPGAHIVDGKVVHVLNPAASILV
jgi:phage terminase large subunit